MRSLRRYCSVLIRTYPYPSVLSVFTPPATSSDSSLPTPVCKRIDQGTTPECRDNSEAARLPPFAAACHIGAVTGSRTRMSWTTTTRTCRCPMTAIKTFSPVKNGTRGRARTCDMAVNRRPLRRTERHGCVPEFMVGTSGVEPDPDDFQSSVRDRHTPDPHCSSRRSLTP